MTSDVVAPIPGKVLRINCRIGDKVTADTSVVTLESMKMEIDVYPDVAGTLSEVLVKVGDFAEQGKVLARVD
ncbi:MAG: acetyl-CoA carboxylase biotin carboxyl carrier protein subunit [Conexivisphaerales archaeon]|jgi:biotin carboxyl carrier protein